jgi:hypothetical protein
MPKIDIAAVPERKGVGYPKPFDALSADRTGIPTRTSSSMCSKASSC